MNDIKKQYDEYLESLTNKMVSGGLDKSNRELVLDVITHHISILALHNIPRELTEAYLRIAVNESYEYKKEKFKS